MSNKRNCFSVLNHFKTYFCITFTLLDFTVLSQNKTEKEIISKVLASVDIFRNGIPVEKLYLHFEKSYYITGDRQWFKVYLFEANFLRAWVKSGICISHSNKLQNIDLQFKPEGGNLVNGLIANLGFKSSGEESKGVQIAGNIYISKQQEVATFKSIHKGMGSVELTPQKDESYTSKLNLHDDAEKTYSRAFYFTNPWLFPYLNNIIGPGTDKEQQQYPTRSSLDASFGYPAFLQIRMERQSFLFIQPINQQIIRL